MSTLIVSPCTALAFASASLLGTEDSRSLVISPRSLGDKPPTGWGHLAEDTCSGELLLANIPTPGRTILVVESEVTHSTRELMSMVASLSDRSARTRSDIILVYLTSLTPPNRDESVTFRTRTLIRRMEETLFERSMREGFRSATLHLPHPYGDESTLKNGLNDRLRAASRGESYHWPAKPEEEPSLIHVGDAAQGICAAVEEASRGGERLWLRGESEVTFQSLATMIAELTGNRSKVHWPEVSFFGNLFGGSRRQDGRNPTIGRMLQGRELSEKIPRRKQLGSGLRETLLQLAAEKASESAHSP